ncbi:class I SAM-dependent methyltransferase [Streptomyces sp. CBMA156]|uniref:class I SAM-dependent methyltransferase n=1 Tax=Streptomyces sp. CBMA156 TaxID=1930280 RepID=UPI001661FC96|nr:class I SAM-dependent methyltransferase [Streptomyces sp. CBMA156]MBD0670832.1 methyltransferase [Streptomyces sp. CBMA156]
MRVDAALADTWVERWERQQERYAVEREERFTVIADVLEQVVGPCERPLVADLGSGPGSLSARVAARLPHAEIVAVDIDPLLLALGSARHPQVSRWVETLIGRPGWIGELGLDRPLDAVMSTTALHYPPPDALLGIYRDLAGALRPGGLLVNGDHLIPEDRSLAELALAVGRRRAQRLGTGTAEDWSQWWEAAGLVPEFADLLSARARQLPPSDGTGNGLSAAQHGELLRMAGFRQAGSVWQYGTSSVVVALR